MEPQLHAELLGDVKGFIGAELLVGSHVINRKRRGLIIHRRSADAPVDIIRLHRPALGHLILRAGAQRPSAMLSKRDVGDAVDGETGSCRRRWNTTTPQS